MTVFKNNNTVKVSQFLVLFIYSLLYSISVSAVERLQVETLLAQGMELLGAARYDEAEKRFEEILEIEPRSAEAHFRIGHVSLLKRRLNKALDYMLEASSIEPKNILYSLNVAHVFERMNQIEDAIKEYERILTFGGDDPRLKIVEKRMTLASGSLLVQQGEVDAALLLFNGLLLEYPEDVAILRNISLAYLRLKRFDDAAAILTRLEKLKPNDAELQLQLANLDQQQGDFDSTIRRLQKFIQLKKQGKDVSEAQIRLAMLQGQQAMNLKRWEDAITFFDTAIKFSPRNVEARFNRSMSLAQLGKLKEAEQGLKEALTLDPNNLSVRLNLGSVYTNMSQFDKAKEQFTFVLKNDKRGVYEGQVKARMNFLHTVLADKALGEGDVETSLKEYEQALAFHSGNVKASFNKGLILVEQRRYAEAAKEFESIIQSVPDSTGARLNLANVYESMQRFAEAVTLYEEIIELAEIGSRYAMTAERKLPIAKGRALLAQGDMVNSEKIFLEVILKQPTNPHVHYYLGVINTSRGDYSTAAKHYQTILNLIPTNQNVRLQLGQVYEMLELEELAAQEYRRVLFGSRNPALADRAKIRLDAVEARLSGFSRNMNYQFMYQDNFNQNDEDPLEEIISMLSFNVNYSYKFRDDRQLLLSLSPSYSSYHIGQIDYFSYNAGASLRLGKTDNEWTMGVSQREMQSLISEQNINKGQSITFGRGLKVKLPAVFGLAPDSFKGQAVPTKARTNLDINKITSFQGSRLDYLTGSWGLAAQQQLRGGVTAVAQYTFSLRRNTENFVDRGAGFVLDPQSESVVNTEEVVLFDSLDYETNTHGFLVYLSKVFAPGLSGAVNLNASLANYVNRDSGAKLRGEDVYRQNVLTGVTLQINYRFVKDISFLANVAWARNFSNLPAGVTVETLSETTGDEDTTIATRQSLSLGDYTTTTMGIGLSMQF